MKLLHSFETSEYLEPATQRNIQEFQNFQLRSFGDLKPCNICPIRKMNQLMLWWEIKPVCLSSRISHIYEYSYPRYTNQCCNEIAEERRHYLHKSGNLK